MRRDHACRMDPLPLRTPEGARPGMTATTKPCRRRITDPANGEAMPIASEIAST